MVSPTDIRNDVFTARPTRSQSFRDPTIKGTPDTAQQKMDGEREIEGERRRRKETYFM